MSEKIKEKTSERRRFYENIIVHTIKDKERAIISSTPDFDEYIFQNTNYVSIFNTINYRFVVLKFKNEEDAKLFKKVIINVSRALSELPDSDEDVGSFFFSSKREFIKAILSFFEDAEVIAWQAKVREKVLDQIKY